MNYADIKRIDIANGTGVRVSLFVSGCNRHCKNCFNKETWDFNYGKQYTKETEIKILDYLKPDYIAGLSILGGEPFEHINQKGILPLVKKVKELYPKKNIWCYTGFDFDKDILGKMINEFEETKELIQYLDVLVDGEFIEELKNSSLWFKGSSNQRVIDVKKSLEKGQIVLVKEKRIKD